MHIVLLLRGTLETDYRDWTGTRRNRRQGKEDNVASSNDTAGHFLTPFLYRCTQTKKDVIDTPQLHCPAPHQKKSTTARMNKAFHGRRTIAGYLTH